jgi:beta-lactamase regulating signal transducer with metallopeptidase domain
MISTEASGNIGASLARTGEFLDHLSDVHVGQFLKILWRIVCVFVLFLFVIALSVRLRTAASDYPLDAYNHVLRGSSKG